jgi:hypothetical protein
LELDNYYDENLFEEEMRFLLILLLVILSGCAVESSEQTQVSCPRGISNDPYPGQCGQYIDNNANGICDQGETS